MASTLIVNPGSTSRKYALYTDGVCVVVLFCEATGAGFCANVIRNGVKISEEKMTANEFAHSVKYAVTYLTDHTEAPSNGIDRVGVRVVAPGTHFMAHRTIDSEYIQKLKEIEDVAPLHIPGLIQEIKSIEKVLPGTAIYGISDSAFHETVPAYISTVSIPKEDALKYDIRRFGYHGISIASIARRLAEKLGEVPARTIVCHVGGGVSVAALKDGKSISTSMGYSPVSGTIMGSRGGDLTAGVVAALTVFKRLHGKKLYDYLYKESGFKGVAGVSDLRLVLERRASGDPDAVLAIDMFVHEVHSWIGAHATLLGGVDAIVLTATAAERNPAVRSLLLSGLELFGVEIDAERNDSLVGAEGFIHTEGSKVKVLVLKTDEMGEMEREVQDLATK
jgi:acetate kinase